MSVYINGVISDTKYGTATVTVGNTYVDVTHNVGTTPNWVHVDPTNEFGIDNYEDTIGAATFRINIWGSQASDATFNWQAGR